MRVDSIQIREGSKIVNLTVDSGTSFPETPNPGELFYRSDNETLYLYNSSTWTSVGGGGGGGSYTITGDVTGTIDGGTDALTLATVNSNVGSFGSATQVTTITVNAKGLVTAAASTSIAIPASAITDFAEAIQDAVGAFVSASSGITVTYDDTNNTYTIGTNAMSSNVNGAIVIRDGSGNFAASTITASLTGNASTATALQTSRSISISGDATWTVNFDGTTSPTGNLTLATVNSNTGTFGSANAVPTLTVNAKGLITAVSNTSIAIAASQVTSGTFDDARIAASNVTQHQGSLAISTAQVTSGTFADARIAASNVTQHQGALAIAASQVTSGTFADARFATSNITQFQSSLVILESQITDGTLLARNAGNETITGTWTFNNIVSASTAPTLGPHLTNKTYVDAQVVAASAGLAVVQVAGTSQTAVSNVHYILSNTGATTTVTLPATPTIGDQVWISNWTTRFDVLVARNGNPIFGAAENLTIDQAPVTVNLRYVDATRGWILV